MLQVLFANCSENVTWGEMSSGPKPHFVREIRRTRLRSWKKAAKGLSPDLPGEVPILDRD